MSIANLLNKQIGRVALTAASTVCVLSLAINTASAGPREQAKYIHDRIASSAADNATLTSMANDISGGNVDAAIDTAMQNPNFLNVTVKNMVVPMTNKESTVFFPFNDAAATMAGYIRDGLDYRGILSDDVIYTLNAGGLPGYSTTNNNHYAQAEHQNVNLRTALQQQTQSTVTGYPPESTSGVLTTRASARAFFYAGTNRAMFRFAMLNYLCVDLEEIKDVTRVNDRVRQDVSRSPGGDSDIFLNNCVGCHAGMDGLAGGYAYHQWGPPEFDPDDTNPDDESMTYVVTPRIYQIDGVDIAAATRVTQKHFINRNNFIYGYATVDDGWINYWRTGVNAKLGWANNTPQAPTTGSGAASLGTELANTEAFARCQVLKVYRHVCHNDPAESTLQTITNAFSGSTYDMRTVYRESVKDCMSSNTNL